ncbi:MAG TPA: sialidase family protein, partial [Candidatus Thermoplasmatota archaeon]|nr:sialidase family protein [Candidatus Thermoplasmatota archaeon]
MSTGRAAFVGTILLVTLFAGCLDGDTTTKEGGKDAKVRAGTSGAKPGLSADKFGARVQVYDKDGLTPLAPPEFPSPLNVTTHSLGRNCGEPTGGVTWKNDWVWEVCSAAIMRSKDHGVTWEQVSTQVSSPTTLDPYMWVDTITDRVYSVQLYVGCSWLSYTDDYGGLWVTNPAACGLPVNDHQTMAGGPPAPPAVSNPVYRNHLYYCVNQLVDTMCSTSVDGGLTWVGKPAQVTVVDVEAGRQCSAINGHVVVGKDGTAYLPKRTCNRPSVMVSTNNGATWEEKVVSKGHAVVQSLAHDPTVTTDSAGNAYYFWTGDDGVLRLS